MYLGDLWDPLINNSMKGHPYPALELLFGSLRCLRHALPLNPSIKVILYILVHVYSFKEPSIEGDFYMAL